MSEHINHEMHENSLEAFDEERAAGRFINRAAAIEVVFRAASAPMTDREVMKALEFTDPNAVRPRINEMIAKGILEEVDSVICPDTGKRVRRCQIRTEPLPAPEPAVASPTPIQATLF